MKKDDNGLKANVQLKIGRSGVSGGPGAIPEGRGSTRMHLTDVAAVPPPARHHFCSQERDWTAASSRTCLGRWGGRLAGGTPVNPSSPTVFEVFWPSESPQLSF